LFRPRPEDQAAGVHCYHVYDETFGLFALTAASATGRQWTVVLDPDEFSRVADLVSVLSWPASEGRSNLTIYGGSCAW
jgi:hypothetical protein